MLLSLLCLALAAQAAVLPQDASSPLVRKGDMTAEAETAFVLPKDSKDPAGRAQAIQYKRENFLYGPSPAGDPAYYPAGPLGNKTAAADLKAFYDDFAPFRANMMNDTAKAMQAAIERGGLHTLEDYTRLYEGQWKKSVPQGVDAGMLSNYTNDLLFSMERLSTSPFGIKRLNPRSKLPFTIEDELATKIAGQDMRTLHENGNLFYIDWRSQKDLPLNEGRYSAACDAYFFVHPESSHFLPLAIRAYTTTDMIYTPLDQPDDWLLAKMMFNTADLWGGQFYHLVNTHDLAEIVYEAAIRTLSDNHPVLGVMKRLNLQAFAMRPAAAAELINPGGAVDRLFPHPGKTVPTFAGGFYLNEGAGSVRGNYLYENFRSRGLIDNSFGPTIKHVPFFEDARAIFDEIHKFMTTFVESYYPTAAEVLQDEELQAWMREADEAKIIDFPAAPIRDSNTLVDLLSFVAYLVGVSHQVQNTNDPFGSIATLPFHPASFWKPLPTAKGASDLAAYLPPLEQAIGQMSLMAGFGRPAWFGTNRTIVHMFNEPTLLSRLNQATRDAQDRFQAAMRRRSDEVFNRSFDADGLSQGMPFLWKVLDPSQATFYLTV